MGFKAFGVDTDLESVCSISSERRLMLFNRASWDLMIIIIRLGKHFIYQWYVLYSATILSHLGAQNP